MSGIEFKTLKEFFQDFWISKGLNYESTPKGLFGNATFGLDWIYFKSIYVTIKRFSTLNRFQWDKIFSQQLIL